MDTRANARTFTAMHAAIRDGLVRACHDLSEGGLAVAAAEMAFAGGLGAELDTDAVPAAEDLPAWKRLFSESHGRFLIETPNAKDLLERFQEAGVPAARIGTVTGEDLLTARAGGRKVLEAPLADLKEAWQAPLRW